MSCDKHWLELCISLSRCSGLSECVWIVRCTCGLLISSLYTSTWQRYLFFFLFVVHNEELLTARQVLPAHPSLLFWVAEVWESPKSRKNKIDLVHVDPESSASVH